MTMNLVRRADRDTQAPTETGDFALQVRDLATEFRTDNGALRAVDDVSFDLRRGKVLCVIGESGSGKSAMLRSILGINPPSARVSGQVLLGGRDVQDLPPKERARTRGGEISMVFQDPLTALDPVYTVEKQLTETLRRHRRLGRRQARAAALDLLELVEIPSAEARLKSYPAQLSGGMRQRVVIAMAVAGDPRVLLADEPTTALDVTVQARVLSLFRSLLQNSEMSLVLVTHDLGVAAEMADDIAVMYAGRFVETGSAEQVLLSPNHPYTRGLIEANVHPGQQARPRTIAGAPPSLARLPGGCAFAPRCEHATVSCWNQRPGPTAVDTGHTSSCLHARSAVHGIAV